MQQPSELVGVYGHVGSVAALGTFAAEDGYVDPLDRGQTYDGALFPVLRAMAETEASGRLTVLVNDQVTLDVGLREGKVTMARERGVGNNESLYLALKELRPTAETLIDKAMEEATRKGLSLSRLLVDKGYLNGKEIVRAILESKLNQLGTAIEAESGAYHWVGQSAKAVKDDPAALPLDGLMCLWLRRFTHSFYEQELHERLRGLMEYYPRISAENAAWIRKWGWPEREVNGLRSTFDGRLQLSECLHGTSLSLAAAARIATAAIALNKIELLHGAVSTTAVVSLEQSLGDEYERIKKANYFGRLGLHWTCHPEDIRRMMGQLRDRYAPKPTHQGMESAIRHAITGLLEEAFSVLNNKETRLSYREKEIGPVEIHNMATFMFEQARQMRLRGERAEAIRQLEAVQDLGVQTAEILEAYDAWKSGR